MKRGHGNKKAQKSTMIQTTHIVGTAAFDQLSAEWDSLATIGITDTPFQKLSYQKIWYEHLGEGDLHTLAVRDGETLIGIGCFNLRGDLLTFNASKEETDYLDVICSAENAPVVWREILTCLCTGAGIEWSTLDLYNIPAESPSMTIVPELAAECGLSFAQERAEVCPIITLPETYDDYLAGIDKKQRHELKRKGRRANGAGAEVRIVNADDDLSAEVDAFLTLLQSSTQEKRDWLNDARTAAFHALSKAALDDGTLQLMFIEVDGEKAATLFNFDYKGRTWVYNSGLNPDLFGRLSLGVTLSAKAIEKAIELGHSEFDFLRGDEQYKYRFGAVDREIFRLTMTK